MPSSRLPLILQTEVAECGLACLAMVACHHGFRTDLSTLRGRFPGSLSGASFETLTLYAERLKLSALPCTLTLEELPQLKTPAILHWGMSWSRNCWSPRAPRRPAGSATHRRLPVPKVRAAGRHSRAGGTEPDQRRCTGCHPGSADVPRHHRAVD